MKNKTIELKNNHAPQATRYSPVIGLETHVELKTKSKMFCGCSADYFGKEPNTLTCPVCLGLPGALPVPNRTAIEWCVLIGLALNCKIPLFSKFDRKNYFYPDLPKGYQISQYDKPFATGGSIVIARRETTKQSQDSGQARMTGDRHANARDDKKVIRIRRVHMEEDTAKLMHQFGDQKSNIKNQKYSLIDFNRSGVPLVEIVTEPDFESAEEVVEYLKKLQQIVRYLGVSDADMEKGQMRLEPNVSLRSRNTTNTTNNTNFKLPNYKVEVKNINSFKFVDKAIEFEVKRQTEILDSGNIPTQETRGWNETKNETVSQRSKEEAMDYRYFPEPDIPPILWTGNQILNIKNQIGELPDQKIEKYTKDFGLSEYDAEILARNKQGAETFEKTIVEARKENATPKQVANVMINKKLNSSEEIISAIKTSQTQPAIDAAELDKLIKEVLEKNQKAIEDYKNGKEQSLMFLLGQVLRLAGAKLNADEIKEKLKKLMANG